MDRIGTRKVIAGIILSLLILMGSQGVAFLVSNVLEGIHVPTVLCNVVGGMTYIILVYVLLKVLVSKYLGGTLEMFGMPKLKVNLKWILVAFLLPLIVISIYLCMQGRFEHSGMNVREIMNTVSFSIFFIGLGAGFVEEMVFRGIILNILGEKYGKKVAIIAPSLLFGFVHIIGMNFNLLSNVLVMIAGTFVGVMFSLIALERHSVWNSAIVHAVWNMMIIGNMLSIGEVGNQNSIYSYVLNSKLFVITGGEFGIESSIIAVIGYIVVAGIAYRGIKSR